jgi:hypothetical protein
MGDEKTKEFIDTAWKNYESSNSLNV